MVDVASQDSFSPLGLPLYKEKGWGYLTQDVCPNRAAHQIGHPTPLIEEKQRLSIPVYVSAAHGLHCDCHIPVGSGIALFPLGVKRRTLGEIPPLTKVTQLAKDKPKFNPKCEAPSIVNYVFQTVLG